MTFDNGTVACTCHEWLIQGPTLVREYPNLHTVRITNRWPQWVSQTARSWLRDTYRQSTPERASAPCLLPPPLFVFLPDCKPQWGPASGGELDSHVYSSQEEAEQALSEACLAWARKEAGQEGKASD